MPWQRTEIAENAVCAEVLTESRSVESLRSRAGEGAVSGLDDDVTVCVLVLICTVTDDDDGSDDDNDDDDDDDVAVVVVERAKYSCAN